MQCICIMRTLPKNERVMHKQLRCCTFFIKQSKITINLIVMPSSLAVSICARDSVIVLLFSSLTSTSFAVPIFAIWFSLMWPLPLTKVRGESFEVENEASLLFESVWLSILLLLPFILEHCDGIGWSSSIDSSWSPIVAGIPYAKGDPDGEPWRTAFLKGDRETEWSEFPLLGNLKVWDSNAAPPLRRVWIATNK